MERENANPMLSEAPLGIFITGSEATESLIDYLMVLKVKGLHGPNPGQPNLIVVSSDYSPGEVDRWIADWLDGKDLEADETDPSTTPK